MIELSGIEKAQLGKTKELRNGSESEFSYPDAALWKKLREYLVERSLKSNPKLDRALTAYTPGETLGLLDHPKIVNWRIQMQQWQVPAKYKTIAFVPCAKTKPWEGPAVARSVLYSAYNQLRSEQDQVYFVTISEPLGVVPMDFWSSFPQYDNPGLFHDDALRSGLMSEQWKDSPAGKKMIVPFDEAAYEKCVALLGEQIGQWMEAQGKRSFVAFVANADYSLSTHDEMLRYAQKTSGIKIESHLKKPVARQSPYGYIREVLAKKGVRFNAAARKITDLEKTQAHAREAVREI